MRDADCHAHMKHRNDTHAQNITPTTECTAPFDTRSPPPASTPQHQQKNRRRGAGVGGWVGLKPNQRRPRKHVKHPTKGHLTVTRNHIPGLIIITTDSNPSPKTPHARARLLHSPHRVLPELAPRQPAAVSHSNARGCSRSRRPSWRCRSDRPGRRTRRPTAANHGIPAPSRFRLSNFCRRLSPLPSRGGRRRPRRPSTQRRHRLVRLRWVALSERRFFLDPVASVRGCHGPDQGGGPGGSAGTSRYIHGCCRSTPGRRGRAIWTHRSLGGRREQSKI